MSNRVWLYRRWRQRIYMDMTTREARRLTRQLLTGGLRPRSRRATLDWIERGKPPF